MSQCFVVRRSPSPRYCDHCEQAGAIADSALARSGAAFIRTHKETCWAACGRREQGPVQPTGAKASPMYLC